MEGGSVEKGEKYGGDKLMLVSIVAVRLQEGERSRGRGRWTEQQRDME